MFITLEQAARDLKITDNEQDKDLKEKIQQVSAGILSYLKDVDFYNSDGDFDIEDVPLLVQQAAILWLRGLYMGEIGLSQEVKNILDLYGRSPSLA